MQVYKVGIDSLAIGPLTSKLKSSLYIGPTLWLVSGGSNIKISVAVMQSLDSELTQNLIVALADERYGPYDHPDSNWFQLKDAGFEVKRAQIIEPLKEPADLAATTDNYASTLDALMDEVGASIGQFGMGTDGHIAGILPNSPAAVENSALACGYQSNPFTRITITFPAIRRLHSAFLIAFGEDKRAQLEKLTNKEVPLEEQPAQVIKQVSESYVYNDQIGGKQ